MSIFVQGLSYFRLTSLQRGGFLAPLSVGVMRSFTVVFATAFLCPAADLPAGRWEGVAHIPGIEMRIIVDLGLDSRGGWTGSATLPGFDVKGAPLTDISVSGEKVAFTVPHALGGLKIAGRLDADGNFTGELEQGGNKAQCTLGKTGPGQPEPPRLSTAVSKELEGEWRGDLTVPGNQFLVKLVLANHAGGPATAQFSVKAKEETNLPVDLIVQEGEWLTINCREFNLRYEAQLRPDHNEIGGVVSQGGFEAPMSLRRVAQAHR